MKCLTVCQPFASLIASGQKRVENRRWGTGYRGPLLIHAGKSREFLEYEVLDDLDGLPDPLPFGAIVGRVRIVACVKRGWIDTIAGALADGSLRPGLERLAWLTRHWAAEGPYCWVFDGHIERATVPIPCRGAQGLFDVPQEALASSAWEPGRTAGVCWVCGCTDASACDEGCEWVEPDLCSACVDLVRPRAKTGPRAR